MSLSARRAWIEIFYYADKDCDWVVALRKESVDRNATSLLVYLALIRSLSARRAWIEIPHTLRDYPASKVALRKESVDRNAKTIEKRDRAVCRSPQGERG